MKVVHTLLLTLTVATAAGCGSTPTQPITSTVETYASRIQEKGLAWKEILVPVAGDVTLQLVSISQTDAVVNLGIGTIVGTKCVLAASVDTAANSAAVAPQITRTLTQASYCVQVADIGKLTQTVDFSVSIQKPY